MYPESLEALIDAFMVLPGVGRKTAERYAFHMLENDVETSEFLGKSLHDIHQRITHCSRCYNYAESDLCSICKDTHRHQDVICVVATPKDIYSIEKTGQYNGVYHVLGGLISTRKGMLPEDIEIDSLLSRLDSKGVNEVILALSATVEGETTALYLSKRLENRETAVTRLAFGLPIGGQLEYADDMTLMKAFEGRKRMK